MTNIQPLLEPIAGDSPCGNDISYDQAFLNLETLAKGKEETQFSPAEEPNWKEVRDAAMELTQQSKHLRVAVLLALALLKIDGVEGLRNGLLVLKTWIDQYWDQLHPLLDPDDNYDPTQRVNILQTLSSAKASQEKFVERLSEIPLAESPSLGRYGLSSVAAGKSKDEIDAAFRDTDAELLRARYTLAVESAALVKEIDNLLATKIGRAVAPNFDALSGALKQMVAMAAPFCGGTVTESEQPAAAGASGSQPAAAGASLGAINSRADVVRALEAICKYYRANEPASPIPFLLERAQRLVDKDFMAIVADLAPGAAAQFEVLGARPPDTSPST